MAMLMSALHTAMEEERASRAERSIEELIESDLGSEPVGA
jgi:hypothetical protein